MNDPRKIQNFIIKMLIEKARIKTPPDLPYFNHNTHGFGQYRLDFYL